MDAAEGEGVINVSNADYLMRPLRLGTDEALGAGGRAAHAGRDTGFCRTQRGSPSGRQTGTRRWCGCRASGRGTGGGRRRSCRRRRRHRPAGIRREAPAASLLLGAGTRRNHRTRRRPDAAGARRWPAVSGGLVPPRGVGPAIPARPNRVGSRCSMSRRTFLRRLAPGIWRWDLPAERRRHVGHDGTRADWPLGGRLLPMRDRRGGRVRSAADQPSRCRPPVDPSPVFAAGRHRADRGSAGLADAVVTDATAALDAYARVSGFRPRRRGPVGSSSCRAGGLLSPVSRSPSSPWWWSVFVNGRSVFRRSRGSPGADQSGRRSGTNHGCRRAGGHIRPTPGN